MKIRMSELRRIIREALNEQGWLPGRWYPASGEPLDRDEVSMLGDKMGSCGCEDEETEEWGNLGSCDCGRRH